MSAVLDLVGRTEVEVAADAVWALFEAGVLRKTPDTIHRAARAVRIPIAALRDADGRYRRAHANPPRTDALVPDPPAPPPEPSVVVVSARHVEANRHTRRYQVAHPEPGKRRCARCKEVKPETPEFFPWKVKARGVFHSYCRPCHTDQQRERRLTVSKVRALNAVGLTFVISAVDPLGTLACMDCGRALKAGDEVHGRTSLRHVVCPKGRR